MVADTGAKINQPQAARYRRGLPKPGNQNLQQRIHPSRRYQRQRVIPKAPTPSPARAAGHNYSFTQLGGSYVNSSNPTSQRHRPPGPPG